MLVVAGLVFLVAGAVQIFGGSAATGVSSPAASPAVTTGPAPTSTAPVVTSTSFTTTTTLPSTTTIPTTTTTAAVATTTTAETFDAFVASFRRALDTDDVEFLFARLHPRVAEAYGAELCRGFIEREIVELDDYQTVGDPVGPRRKNLEAGGTTITLDGVYDVDVSFMFGGQAFSSPASFVFDGTSWFWVGQCR